MPKELIFIDEVIVMKIGQILSGDTKKQLNDMKKARRRRWRKKKENLSFKDIENLMGLHRDRYKRGRGGAVKRT